MKRRRAAVLTIAMATLGCGGGPTSPPYDPVIPTSWAPTVSHPFFPLIPGTRSDFRAETSNGVETSRVEVLSETRTIMGVTATIVHDQVFLDGSLTEDTFDWFAQDADGNVWYLGEDTRELDHGQLTRTEGSWEWGVAGALPGVVMWADPSAHMAEEYRQEYLKGVAEDLAVVVGLDETVQVPAGSLSGCLRTRERNALESGSTEYKYYCRDVGTVLETDGSGGERNELQTVNGP